MATQDISLEGGLRQLLAMRGSERQATLATLSANHPPARPQAARGTGLKPHRSPPGLSSGLAQGPGRQPSQQLPMKVPLPADCGGGLVQQEAHAGPACQQPRGPPRAPPPQHGEGDCNQLVQSITNAMSRILLDGGAPGAGHAVREERLRHIEWLRGQLELQQEQSMRKISHMVDHRGCAPAKPAGPPAAAAAAPRRNPHAAQGPPAGSHGHGQWPRPVLPQEAGAGSTLHRPRNMKQRDDDYKQSFCRSVPGWDPQLALAAAEAAGGVPSHWAPAVAEVPPRAAWPQQQPQASQRVSGEESSSQHVKGVDMMASDTLRSHLRAMQEVDSRRVVQVRKISKLGFQSGAALESHFSAFGTVECVRVAFSHVKPQSTGLAVRIRPSGLGFVVMSSIEDAEAILRAGENQVVSGVEVLVRPYEVRAASEKAAVNEDEDELFAGA